jgi:hypothetical protein
LLDYKVPDISDLRYHYVLDDCVVVQDLGARGKTYFVPLSGGEPKLVRNTDFRIPGAQY